jgi:hypothetical protein
MRARSIVLVCVLAGSCGPYFAPDRNVSEFLPDAAIVGTWRLTRESLANIERDGFRRERSHRYVIVLRRDRTCEFASVVAEFKGSRYVESSCVWVLQHQTRGDSNVEKANALQLQVKGQEINFNFTREHGELMLWDYCGDPDEWKFLEYSRRSSDDQRPTRDSMYAD